MAERPALSSSLAQADRGRIESPAALLGEWYHHLADPSLPPPHVHDAAFGPFAVQARFHGFTAKSAYGHALRPGRSRGRPPALTIDILDGAACGLPRPKLAWQVADFGPKQIVPGWSDPDRTTYLLRLGKRRRHRQLDRPPGRHLAAVGRRRALVRARGPLPLAASTRWRHGWT